MSSIHSAVHDWLWGGRVCLLLWRAMCVRESGTRAGGTQHDMAGPDARRQSGQACHNGAGYAVGLGAMQMGRARRTWTGHAQMAPMSLHSAAWLVETNSTTLGVEFPRHN